MLWYGVVFTSLLSSFTSSEDVEMEEKDWLPYFGKPIGNVTVPLGREAILDCIVRNLGLFKVGWLKAEDQTVLTLDKRVVTHNSRIGVSHEPDREAWRLHIRHLKHSDRGCYMCQINTTHMKKQIGCLDVHVPPDILDGGTSSDLVVEEGDNVTLSCIAKGHPFPRIIWRREDARMITFYNERGFKTVETYNGESLRMMRIDYTQMGAYLCIATNDIPPAVSKRIVLLINFAPVVKSPNQVVGTAMGSTLKLQCDFHAFPNHNTSWQREIGELHDYGGDYSVEMTRSWYDLKMYLTIRNMRAMDFGKYFCIVANKRGIARGTIQVYESQILTTTTQKTTTERITTDEEREGLGRRTWPPHLQVTGTTTGRTPMEEVIMLNEVDGGVEASSRRRSFTFTSRGGQKSPKFPLLVLSTTITLPLFTLGSHFIYLIFPVR